MQAQDLHAGVNLMSTLYTFILLYVDLIPKQAPQEHRVPLSMRLGLGGKE